MLQTNYQKINFSNSLSLLLFPILTPPPPPPPTPTILPERMKFTAVTFLVEVILNWEEDTGVLNASYQGNWIIAPAHFQLVWSQPSFMPVPLGSPGCKKHVKARDSAFQWLKSAMLGSALTVWWFLRDHWELVLIKSPHFALVSASNRFSPGFEWWLRGELGTSKESAEIRSV